MVRLSCRLFIPSLVLALLGACGGGSSGGGNAPPVVQIASPAEGSSFKGGDTIAFTASATDPEDGALPEGSLSWWADLHHDEHTHPLQLPTAGGSGSLSLPARSETSPDIFIRFHLKATDSAGQVVEVTRDVQPLKVQVTVATEPAGLALTLDGQPITGPKVFTGVVGIERDLAAADQTFNGRRYRFDGWSDGQPATHTIATPAADSTYTARFTDLGPATNVPPAVTLTAAATGTAGTAMNLTASASDPDGSIAKVEFFDGTTSLGSDTTTPYALSWTPATAAVHSLTAVATDNLGARTTSAAVAVTVSAPAGGGDTQPPVATLTSPADLRTGITGTLTLSATASDDVGVAGVEFQIDGVAVGTEDTTAPYEASVDVTPYATGQHIVRARSRDAAGNVSPWSRATVTFGFTTRLPAGFTKTEGWVAGMANVTAFAQAPDGRLFVCEQDGALRVVKNGTLLPTPFHQFTVDTEGERGLVGVAFHPDFASNGFVYVYYTATTPTLHNRISRLVASGDVSTGAETVLADLPTLVSTTHNGGALHFGPDGKLYAAVGDNRRSTDAADPSKLFGKILRMNDDGSIPADNPFYAANSGLARAVWAYGLRNPFTFAFQKGSSRMHINDVGENSWEEINVGAPGANFGWPSSEGPNNLVEGMTGPLFTYNHNQSSPAGSGPGGFLYGAAITGGAFYPADGSFPAAYRNSYYFADYGRKWVSRLDLANEGDAYSFAAMDNPPVDMLVGQDGALYVLERPGSIARISGP